MSIFNQNIFDKKLVLISGGATGIGYQISRQFLMHGASVYIISRKLPNILKAISLLGAETKNMRVYGSSCDVRSEKQIEQTVVQVVRKYGAIDILVNGAAGNFLCPFQKLTANGFRTVLMIDTVGTFLLSKYVNEHGFKKKGVVINISANLHYSGTALQTHAGTAKAGVDALTKHMAVELGPKGVRVVGVCPGIIADTQGYERLSMGESQSHARIVPLQRLGKKEDIAKCCLFVASDAADYLTGQTIVVDGGVTLSAPNFPFMSPAFVAAYSKI